MHGLDPFDCVNLSGLRDYLKQMGFKNTYYGQFWAGCTFKDKITEIDHSDPEARIVVIGFSLGATMARLLCETLIEETVPIHLLIYLDGKGLCDFHCQPDRKRPQIVNVVAPGAWSAPHFDYAHNVDINGCWHFGTATHPETLEALCVALNLLAAEVKPLPSDPQPAAAQKPRRVPPVAEVAYQDSLSERALRRLASVTEKTDKPPKAQVAGEQTSSTQPATPKVP